MPQVTSQALQKVWKGESSDDSQKTRRDGADVTWRGSSFQTQQQRRNLVLRFSKTIKHCDMITNNRIFSS